MNIHFYHHKGVGHRVLRMGNYHLILLVRPIFFLQLIIIKINNYGKKDLKVEWGYTVPFGLFYGRMMDRFDPEKRFKFYFPVPTVER